MSKKTPKDFKPLSDRVLVQKMEEKISSIIHLPNQTVDTTSNQIWKMKVLDVGPGRMLPSGERAEMQVKPGDEILVPSNGCINKDILDEYGINREFKYIISQDFIMTIVR